MIVLEYLKLFNIKLNYFRWHENTDIKRVAERVSLYVLVEKRGK